MWQVVQVKIEREEELLLIRLITLTESTIIRMPRTSSPRCSTSKTRLCSDLIWKSFSQWLLASMNNSSPSERTGSLKTQETLIKTSLKPSTLMVIWTRSWLLTFPLGKSYLGMLNPTLCALSTGASLAGSRDWFWLTLWLKCSSTSTKNLFEL